MKKRIIKIAAICLVCVILVAAALYFIPIKISPIDITMDTVKTDNQGEELGTVQITVHGTLTEYLFRENRLALEIAPIEDLYDIEPWGTDFFNSMEIGQPDSDGFYSLSCNASSTVVGADSYVLTVFFMEDLSRWEFFRTCRIYHHIGEDGEIEPTVYDELNFTYRAVIE